jgi:uncharacterized protein YdeI (YjbR/CyaY-like superfamily)
VGEPAFFEHEGEFRRWLAANHETASELLVGFWKKGSGKPSIDWPQARDQALCFGWIDGVRRSLGDDAYTIRFTPRRKRSIWSNVNLQRFEALKAAGQMTAAGERALADSTGPKGVYAYEKPLTALPGEDEHQFRSNADAWADWEKRPPSYRKVVLHWVTSAKRADTRAARLRTLIECSAAGEKIPGYDIGRKK